VIRWISKTVFLAESITSTENALCTGLPFFPEAKARFQSQKQARSLKHHAGAFGIKLSYIKQKFPNNRYSEDSSLSYYNFFCIFVKAFWASFSQSR
jgi:hypothetical protein